MIRAVVVAALVCVLATAARGDDPEADPRAPGITDLRQRLLGDVSPEIRVLAAHQLLERPEPEAAAAVQEALRSGGEAVQVAALAAVAARRDARFCADVAALLASAREPVAHSALDAAGALGRPMVDVLAEVYAKLANGVEPRRRVLVALGATRSLQAVPLLIPLLEGQPEEIAAEAQKSLALISHARMRTRVDWEEWWRRNHDRGRERILEETLDALENTVRSVDTDAETLIAENRALKLEIVQLRLEAVRKSGTPEAEVLLLRDLLDDKEKRFLTVRAKILDELGRVGRGRAAPALPVVVRLLDESDRKVVLATVRCLGEIGDAASADAIARFLAPEHDPELRGASARALARIATPNAVQPLVSALGDADPVVLLAVIEGVKAIRARSAVPRLQELLVSHRSDPDLAKACVDALGDIGDAEAVPILVDFLARSDPEKDRLARWAAANALGKLKQPQAVDALITLLDDAGAGLRQAAVEALGKIGDPRAGEPLARTVRTDKDPVVRELAAQALGALKDQAALDVLLQALDDPEPRVAKSAWVSVLALSGREVAVLEGVLAKLPPGKHVARAVEVLRLLSPPPAASPETLTDPQKRAQIRLGDVLFEAGEWKEAEPVLEVSSRWFPDNRQVKYRLGVVYRELQKTDAALPIFTALLESALPGSREWWDIKLERLTVRLQRKEFAGVLAEAQALLAKDPPPDLRARLESLGKASESGAAADRQRLDEVKRKVLDVIARSRAAGPDALAGLAEELAPFGREAVPFLIEVLQTGEPADWPAASRHLSVLTNVSAALTADTPADKREKAVQDWMRWFNGAK